MKREKGLKNKREARKKVMTLWSRNSRIGWEKGGQCLKIKKKKKAHKGLEDSRQRSRIQMGRKQCLDYKGVRWAGGR